MSFRHHTLRGGFEPGTLFIRGEIINVNGALYAAKKTLITGNTFNPADFDVVLPVPPLATHSHPASEVPHFSLSTSGAGLPVFSGRKNGDLHYNTTDKKEYVLTGAAGTGGVDNFNRPDGALGSVNGLTYIYGGNAEPNPKISGNRAVGGGTSPGRYAQIPIGSGWQEVKGRFVTTANVSSSVYFRLHSTADGAERLEVQCNWNDFQGYYYTSVNYINNGAQTVLTALPTLSGRDQGVDVSISSTASGLVVTVTKIGLGTQVSKTYAALPSEITTNTYVGFGFSGAATLDDFEYLALGSLAWTSTDEFVAAHTHVPNDVLPKRQTMTFGSSSLAAGAGESGWITMAPGYRLLHINADVACRVRLYTSAAKRDADVTRATTTDPPKGSGLMLDYSVTEPGTANEGLSPLVDGYVADGTDQVAYRITNDSAAAAIITTTLTWVRTE